MSKILSFFAQKIVQLFFGNAKIQRIERPQLETRQALIAQALETPEGRQALANSIPLRRSLDYQGVNRRLLMVEELPPGAYVRYERDIRQTANIIQKATPADMIAFTPENSFRPFVYKETDDDISIIGIK